MKPIPRQFLRSKYSTQRKSFGDIDGLVRNYINITDVSDHQIEGIKYKKRR